MSSTVWFAKISDSCDGACPRVSPAPNRARRQRHFGTRLRPVPGIFEHRSDNLVVHNLGRQRTAQTPAELMQKAAGVRACSMGVMPVPPAIMPTCVHLRSFSPPPCGAQDAGSL